MRFTEKQDRLIAAVIDHAKVIGTQDTDYYVAAIEHVTDDDYALADRYRRELDEAGVDGYALDEKVVGYAQDIARGLLAENDYGDDWPILYRVVRSTMGRDPVCPDIDHPTADDESISQGIINAINEG